MLEKLESIVQSVKEFPVVLLKAGTGAGKTTRVPISLISHFPRKILVLEPRRLAARLSAEFSAQLLEESAGGQVGYQIRHDKKLSDQTRVLFITEGLFVRMLLQDSELQDYSVIVLDEFHERNIYTDQALSLLLHLQKTRRPDLKILIMSATLDTQKLEKFLGEQTPVFDIPGNPFPIEIEYHAPEEGKIRHRNSLLEDKLAESVEQMLHDRRCEKNILVFLSGLGEIRSAQSRLRPLEEKYGVEVLALASSLSPQEQEKVFKKSSRRKIVLATNVAETSLTLPDITGVIDLGLAKVSGYAPWSGMPTLDVQRISKASATQRAGRAGRTQAGVVYRLYSQMDFSLRDDFLKPDILRLELSNFVLDVLSLGFRLEDLTWLDAPCEKDLQSAYEQLQLLGAIDSQLNITPKGSRMGGIPLPPRLASLILAGEEFECEEDAFWAACLISEGIILRQFHYDEKDVSCDLVFQIELIKDYLRGELKNAHYLIDLKKVERIQKLFQMLSPQKEKLLPTKSKELNRALFYTYPDRIGIKRKSAKVNKQGIVYYNFCQGKGGSLDEKSVLSIHLPDYFIAIDGKEDIKGNAARGIQIRMASGLDKNLLKEDPAHFLKKEMVSEFDEKKGENRVFFELFYGKIKIETLKGNIAGGAKDSILLCDLLRANWPYPFADEDALERYHAKIALLDEFMIEHNCPVFKGEMFDLFVAMICEGYQSLNELKEKSLALFIEEQLGEIEKGILDDYTPDYLLLPSGRKAKIEYAENGPMVETFLQNVLDIQKTPTVMQGRLKLKMSLLAPNRRPIQVTNDLESFWNGSYVEIRKEMKRRYPKHRW